MSTWRGAGKGGKGESGRGRRCQSRPCKRREGSVHAETVASNANDDAVKHAEYAEKAHRLKQALSNSGFKRRRVLSETVASIANDDAVKQAEYAKEARRLKQALFRSSLNKGRNSSRTPPWRHGREHLNHEDYDSRRLRKFRDRYPMDDRTFDLLEKCSLDVQNRVLKDFLPQHGDQDDYSATVTKFVNGSRNCLKKPEVPRIGIDIGGVLMDKDREVPGSTNAVLVIAKHFGISNVFVVSKARLGGRMHQMSLQWLHRQNGFLRKTGMLPENVVFVRDISGPNGKGVMAKRLGLSHFVDNKWDALQTVFADKAGNSRGLVQSLQGILFHFATGGSGRWKPAVPQDMSSELEPHYYAVSCWAGVLEKLIPNMVARGRHPSASSSSSLC